MQVNNTERDKGSGIWKHFKVESFPAKIPAAQKAEKWADWLRKFRIVASEMGELSQTKKANMLYVMSGDEIQAIINAKGMFPEGELPEGGSAFDELVAKLTEYFKSLADPSVTLMRFDGAKQEKEEGVREYQLRVFRLAEMCGMRDNGMMVKERFTKGLCDKQLAEMSYVYGWTMEETAAAVARKEAFRASEAQKETYNPLREEGMKMVAAVSDSARGSGTFNQRQGRGGSRGGWDRDRNRGGRNNNSRSSGNTSAKGCPNCGIAKHNGKGCPAIGKTCKSCGKQGHFAAVCRSAVAAVESGNQMKEEREDEKVKIFE